MEPTVAALFVTPVKRGKPTALTEVRLVATGFDGDFHAATADRRQILMISEDILREFALEAGSLFENMVIHGYDVMAFKPGQRLTVGNSILEVTVPCGPCNQMERIRKGLRRSLEGRRGMFARVIMTGSIRVGETVKF